MRRDAESARADVQPTASRAGLVLGIAAALSVITVVSYAPVLTFDFVNFDDPEYVTGNPHVQRGLSLEGVVWALTASHSANWHPLTWMSHMLDCSLFGLAAGAHHAVNLAVHVANTLLLLLFLYRCTNELWPSTLVAALFALHPLHVESVAWIAERKDVLSTLCFLLALLSYATYVHRPSVGRYLLVALTFALGLMAKPMVVTLPFVLLLLDVWPLERLRRGAGFRVSGVGQRSSGPGTRGSGPFSAGHLVLEKLPLFAMAAGASAITYFVQQHSGAVLSLDALPLTFRLGNALIAYLWYLRKTMWPSGLAVFYPIPEVLSVSTIAIAAAVLATISAAAIALARRFPYALVGWLWFVGTLIPVIGIIKAGEQSTADRFTYIPHIGLFILVAWTLRDLAARGRGSAVAAGTVSIAAVVACVSVTSQQLAYWRDGESLFRRALAVTQDNYVAHLNFGQILASRGRPAEALEHFAEAVRLRAHWARARNSYATALMAVGDNDAALQQYDETLRLDPADATAHFNRGLLVANKGALDDAIADYTKALQLKPDYVKAQLSMAIALTAQGRGAEAIERYRAALQLDPSSAIAHTNLAILLEDMGRRPDAIPHYAEAVRLAPNEGRVHFNLGSALEQQGESAAAVQHYRNALQAAPDFAPAQQALDRLSNPPATPVGSAMP